MRITFDQAFHGTEVDFELSAARMGSRRAASRRVPHRVQHAHPARRRPTARSCAFPAKAARAPTAARDGDLYLDIEVADHPLYRVAGNDLYVDLPLAPWEAVLGTSVELPTPAGTVTLKVPPGTRAGQQLRLSGRGMARGSGAAGHLYALVRIEVPSVVDDAQKDLYRKLAESANFDPRAHFVKEASR